MGRLKWGAKLTERRDIAGIAVVAKSEAKVTVSVGLWAYGSHLMMRRTTAVGLGLALPRAPESRARHPFSGAKYLRKSVADAS